ncbi:MAG: 50S ribosomal protein L19e [Candidatus Hadarchaeales archaeon]
MNLRAKKRLAARVLGVGVGRIYIDPARLADVDAAITREDIKRLIKDGAIAAKKARGTSRGRLRELRAKKRLGRRSGPGSRKGARHARMPRKDRWIQTVRPLRRRLRELKKEGIISAAEYRRLYRMVGGGVFRSRSHLEAHLRERGLLK